MKLKKQKKQVKMKELEEAREAEKSKWQTFNAKVHIVACLYYTLPYCNFIITGFEDKERRYRQEVDIRYSRWPWRPRRGWYLRHLWPANDRLRSAREVEKEVKNLLYMYLLCVTEINLKIQTFYKDLADRFSRTHFTVNLFSYAETFIYKSNNTLKTHRKTWQEEMCKK